MSQDYLKLLKLRTKRMTRLAACAVFGAVFVLFAAGAAWSLSVGDYPSKPGKLVTDLVIIAVSLVLAVFTGFRARAFGRRADALSATTPVSWLPRVTDGGSGGAELDEWIRLLRGTGRRSVVVFGAWIGVLLTGASGFVLLDHTGQRLLDTGQRVAGAVESVHEARRGSSSITVSYVADGTRRTVRIYRDWNSDVAYAPGQTVTVVYDPADPGSVRTLAERNDNQLVVWSVVLVITAAFLGIPFSALSMWGWRARYRAVRATGWRAGTADIVQERKKPAMMVVMYRDGSTIHLRTTSCTLRRAPGGQLSAVPVWVGGTDQYMVIVLSDNGRSGRLLALPVKADAPRQDDNGWAP